MLVIPGKILNKKLFLFGGTAASFF